MTDEVSQNAISAAASRMFTTDELAAMSREQRIPIMHRLSWVLKDTPNPTDEELQRHRNELLMTHLYPALTAMQADNMLPVPPNSGGKGRVKRPSSRNRSNMSCG